MKEIITRGGIRIKCDSQAIEFYTSAYEGIPFAALKIPKELLRTAIEFYDLIIENGHPMALLDCRGNYDIVVQLDEMTGTMTGWHWFK